MFQEGSYCYVCAIIVLVADNETARRQLIKKGIDVNLVIAEQLKANSLGSVFHATFAVCQGPEPDEKQSGYRFKPCDVFIDEEIRLDCSNPSHFSPGPKTPRSERGCFVKL